MVAVSSKFTLARLYVTTYFNGFSSFSSLEKLEIGTISLLNNPEIDMGVDELHFSVRPVSKYTSKCRFEGSARKSVNNLI